MKKILKELIKKTPLYPKIKNWTGKRRQENEIFEWEKKGRPAPPPHIIKQQILLSYAKEFQLKIFVETGTYYGDMIEALKGYFDQIYSIELSEELFKKAKRRFEGESNIKIICGDSGIEMEKVVCNISHPALFWLDGHYSAGDTVMGKKATPILEELEHILNTKNRKDVIIIDDVRCFGVIPGYPSIEKIKDLVMSKKSNVNILIKDDCIRITPAW